MKALLLIDLQNDFFPGGALAVSTAYEILPAIHQLMHSPFDLIVATKDWHPIDHSSFVTDNQPLSEETRWPVHCVQGTYGAELIKDVDQKQIDKIFCKGIDKTIDSYSAFFDNKQIHSTGLGDYLRGHMVTDLYIAGVATDYCVKYSVLDALKLKFQTFVIKDACRGVNLHDHDSENAFLQMKEAGAILIEKAVTLTP